MQIELILAQLKFIRFGQPGNGFIFEPASVAQLDECPTGDQEVASLIPAKSSNIL